MGLKLTAAGQSAVRKGEVQIADPNKGRGEKARARSHRILHGLQGDEACGRAQADRDQGRGLLNGDEQLVQAGTLVHWA